MTSSEPAERGLGLYLEFRAGNTSASVSQLILIQETIAPSNGALLPFTILHRVISEQSPQRGWLYAQDNTYRSRAKKNAAKEFIKDQTIEQAVLIGSEVFRIHQGILGSMATGGWAMVGEPLVIGLSEQNVEDIRVKDTPRTLIDRVNRLRAEHNFPALPGRSSAAV